MRPHLTVPLIALAIVVAPLVACSHDEGPRVLIVGDSVTVLSEHELRQEFDWAGTLDLRATSGLRTDQLLAGAMKGAAHNPDIGVFMPGYNDILQDRVDDPALEDMVNLAGQLPCSVWFTLPTTGGFSPKLARRWNARVRKLAEHRPTIRISQEWEKLVEKSPDFTFVKHVDAVHPNPDGQRAIAKVMSSVAKQHCD